MSSLLEETIDNAAERAKLDQACKRFLSHKEVLAQIMQCLDEYKDCSIQDICNKYIEGQPEVSETPLLPDYTERIHGDSTEDVSLSEQTIWYDIKFQATAPGEEGLIGLIINVEAQNRYNPTYPLTKRAFYYCARLISAQYGTVFEKSHYEKIKKVYSIWICLTPPGDRQNTIVRYHVCEDILCGHVHENPQNYDLMEVRILCLGDKDATDEAVLRFLDVLFSETLQTQDKKAILASEFAFRVSDSMEGDLYNMCNLSQGFIERGIEKGIDIGKSQTMLSILKNLLETTGWSFEEVASAMKIPENEQNEYRTLLETGSC